MPTATRAEREQVQPMNDKTLKSWCVPVVGLAIGVVYFVAELVAGDPAFGAVLLLIMVGATGAFVVASRYSETVRGLMDHRDERITGIDYSASLFAGMVLMVVVLGAFVVSLAQGHDGNPYGWLAAIAGVSYIAAVIYLRLRR